MMLSRDVHLAVKDLNVVYLVREGSIKACSNVSFNLDEGAVTSLIGESGSGKSTIVEALTFTLPKNARMLGGNIIYRGIDLLKLSESERRKLKWREIAYIPQAAQNSLNPLLTIFDHFYETWKDHLEVIDRSEAFERASRLLEKVGLDSKFLNAYPHQLSGGMKQRVIIALSMVFQPKLLIMDEPVSALDTLNQSLIERLIYDLYKLYKLTIFFVTHDIQIAGELADRIMVMYAGHLIEIRGNEAFFESPLHPYSQGLVESMIVLSRISEGGKIVSAEPPSLLNPPLGCRFHPRCPYAMDICRKKEPPMIDVGQGEYVKCWLYAKR